jgi:hypothetical protein
LVRPVEFNGIQDSRGDILMLSGKLSKPLVNPSPIHLNPIASEPDGPFGVTTFIDRAAAPTWPPHRVLRSTSASFIRIS